MSLNKEEFEVLMGLLDGKDIDIRRANIIFNAKEHNFSASKFHELCDSKDKTITLVRATNRRLFGGYTHFPFKHNGEW